ncbi:hypothetical protein ANANG_G00301940 [Anguilla anguilla]|uniref:Uncharacterized protein n=1 Tax=Anguilla anguilla TaxID=7936 RepID=A0A9D3LRA5_ANGAN|nr:hypothetical protein ANANG_G00301940 [Anguilla anguilla]
MEAVRRLGYLGQHCLVEIHPSRGCCVAHLVKAPSSGTSMSPTVVDGIWTVPVPTVAGSTTGRMHHSGCGWIQSVRGLRCGEKGESQMSTQWSWRMNVAAVADNWTFQIRMGIRHVQPHIGCQIIFKNTFLTDHRTLFRKGLTAYIASAFICRLVDLSETLCCKFRESQHLNPMISSTRRVKTTRSFLGSVQIYVTEQFFLMVKL